MLNVYLSVFLISDFHFDWSNIITPSLLSLHPLISWNLSVSAGAAVDDKWPQVMSHKSVSGGGVREQWADQTSVAPPPLCCIAPDSHLTVRGCVALWVMSAAGFGGTTDVCLIPDVWIQISDLSSRCVRSFILSVWRATPEVSQRRHRSISFIYIYNQSSCHPSRTSVSCVSGLKKDPSSAPGSAVFEASSSSASRV